ncbi:acyltransferase family protein [Zestomonas insulae]|nr:acyltransferase [Pseudomonas insulae]
MTSNFKSSVVANEQLLPAIHGLRGLAAVAVVLYHLPRLVDIQTPERFLFIYHYFGYSVHLFFVLSAFSLMHTTEKRITEKGWCHDYAIKRFFRIAPLFYSFLAFEIIRQVMTWKLIASTNDILLNLSFTFGFVPFSGIVWGGWSVGVEMIFYALLPGLMLLTSTHRSALLLMIASIVVCYSIRYSLQDAYLSASSRPQWSWSYFSFASNFCYFAMGIYAYRASKFFKKGTNICRVIIPLATSALLVSLCFFKLGELVIDNGRLDIILWGIGFTGLVIWQTHYPSRVLANKAFEFLGERSFSIYLSHPVIIECLKGPLLSMYGAVAAYVGTYAFFPCAAFLLITVLLVSEVTYRLIEVPGIRLGRSLINRRKSAQAAVTVA